MDHEQQTRTRSPRILLRLLLLAGAAVVGWLVLAGGPAQAADHGAPLGLGANAANAQHAGAGPLSQKVSQALSPTVSRIVARTPVRIEPGAAHRTSSLVTKPLRDLPRTTTAVLDTATARAPEPVRRATDQLSATLEPVLTRATGQLADTVDRAATTADSVVDPVLQAAGAEARTSTTPAPVAATASMTARDHTRAHPARALPTTALLTTQSAVSRDAAPESTLDHGEQLPVTPTAPDVPAAPVSPTSAGTVGVLAAAVLPGLTLLHRQRRVHDAPLPTGPTFGPTSSPD